MLDRISEMIEKIMYINNNTKHHVFFNIAPHVNWCEIQIIENGWRTEDYEIEYHHFYYDDRYKEIDYINMMLRLEELLND